MNNDVIEIEVSSDTFDKIQKGEIKPTRPQSTDKQYVMYRSPVGVIIFRIDRM